MFVSFSWIETHIYTFRDVHRRSVKSASTDDIAIDSNVVDHGGR